MKPENTGKVVASPFGRLKRAVMVWLLPGERVKVVWLRDTDAAADERGTGPRAGKIVP